MHALKSKIQAVARRNCPPKNQEAPTSQPESPPQSKEATTNMSVVSQALKGKIALVTGGSRGIGAAITRRLAADGAHVVIVYQSNSSAAESLIQSLPSPTLASAIKADISSPSSCKELSEELVKRHGKLDFVVLSAGLMKMVDPGDITKADEGYHQHFDLNVKGNILLAQLLAPHISEKGRLIFFSSSLTQHWIFFPGYLYYMASKGAVEQASRVFSRYPPLISKKVTVNTVSPGPIATELFFEGKTEEMLNRIKAGNPYNEFGTPEDVAGTVRYLVGEESRWTNGQNLRVNGGMV